MALARDSNPLFSRATKADSSDMLSGARSAGDSLRGLLWGLCAPFPAVRCRYVCHRAAPGAVRVERKLG